MAVCTNENTTGTIWKENADMGMNADTDTQTAPHQKGKEHQTGLQNTHQSASKNDETEQQKGTMTTLTLDMTADTTLTSETTDGVTADKQLNAGAPQADRCLPT